MTKKPEPITVCVQVESLYFEMPHGSTEDEIEEAGNERFQQALDNKEFALFGCSDINKL
jgi:hypothetical protein